MKTSGDVKGVGQAKKRVPLSLSEGNGSKRMERGLLHLTKGDKGEKNHPSID